MTTGNDRVWQLWGNGKPSAVGAFSFGCSIHMVGHFPSAAVNIERKLFFEVHLVECPLLPRVGKQEGPSKYRVKRGPGTSLSCWCYS
jgi:hypothetical protein